MSDKILPIETLNNFIPIRNNIEKCDKILEEALKDFNYKIIILDDDPTGIQTVHGVSVFTNWEEKTIEAGFKEDNSMFFILTNSRSFSVSETKKVHIEIGKRIGKIAKLLERKFLVISRGDSTLRGHYPIETDSLKEGLKNYVKDFTGEIFCPFFLEGGRYTFSDVHYVKMEDMLYPVGKTEFAKDKSFSYSASNLKAFIVEKNKNILEERDITSISIEDIRTFSTDKILKDITNTSSYKRIVVNAISYEDLKVFTAVLIRSIKNGNNYIIRSASSLPKVLGNITDKTLLTKDEIIKGNEKNGGVVVVGSHVEKTTLQLEKLKKSKEDLVFIEFDVSKYFEKKGLEKEKNRIVKDTEKYILSGKTVVIFTSRILLDTQSKNKDKILEASVDISTALTGIVGDLSVTPRFILAKGGITSSDVGTKALKVKKALVLGQIKKGIPVWLTGEESKFPNMPYIIFPGNVGEVDTLCEIVEELC